VIGLVGHFCRKILLQLSDDQWTLANMCLTRFGYNVHAIWIQSSCRLIILGPIATYCASALNHCKIA